MKPFATLISCLVFWQLSAQPHLLVPVVPEGLQTNEPSISIDPKYPAFQVLGSNTSNFFISEDGGLTWNAKALAPKEGFYGDPVTHITAEGNIYLTHLSKTKGKAWPDHFDRIVFQASVDGGENFYSSSLGYTEGKMQDKPWLAVDENKKSPYQNRIYITWTEFDKYGSKDPKDSSRIKFAFSDDYGKTFSEPVVISDVSGDAEDGDNTLEGANLAIGKRGELYCVWAGRNKIWVDISLDGGKTWSKDIEAANQYGGWNIENPSGIDRANSMPFIQLDKKGKLIIIYGHNKEGTQNIYSISSEDKGQTWSAELKVNSNPTQDKTDQYMPHMCKDRKTGTIYATYYTRRFSNNNIFIDVVAVPWKKNKWGEEYRVTIESIVPPGEKSFFGDYISIAAAKKAVRVAYTFFDQSKGIPSVKVALLAEKTICKPPKEPYPAFLTTAFRAKENDVVLHAELPGSTSAIVEVFRGKTLIYKNVYQNLEGPSIEEIIPKSKLGNGLFEIKIRAGINQLESGFFLER